MSDWLSQVTAGQAIALLAITGGMLIAITSVVSAAWVRVRRAEFLAQQAEAEVVLKQQMIEKGMSADEIKRVLAAGQSISGRKRALAEERAHR